MHYNATHEDTLNEVHKIAITALGDELMAIDEDRKQFNTIAGLPLLSTDMIQRLQTAGGHIEQLQKATACEGTGPWKVEACGLAVRQERPMPLCEWLGCSGAVIDTRMTYEELRVCWLETGDAVMAADGTITRAQIQNDLYIGNRQWPIGDEQALYHMELGLCQEILELREEFARESGDLGEGKFLRGSTVRRWKMR